MNASQLWESGDARAWEQAARQAGSAGGLDPLPQDSLGSMDAAAFRDYALERLYPAAHPNPQRLAAARAALNESFESDDGAAVDLVRERLQYLDPADTEWALRVASDLPGLGVAGASTLLAVVFPEHFGALNHLLLRALRSVERLPEAPLLREVHLEILTPEDGAVLVEVLRRKAEQLRRNGTLRVTAKQVSEALQGTR